MNNVKFFTIVLFIVVFSVEAKSVQDTLKISPFIDNTLYENVNGALSNGSGDYLFAGKNSSGIITRCVLAFQLIEFMPQCAKVLSASLRMHVSGSSAVNKTIQVKRLLEFWGEGNSDAPGTEENGTASSTFDATWKHTFYNTDFWTTPGGTFSNTVSASANVGGTGFYTWSSAGLVSDVQSWVDDPSHSWGWILTGDEVNSSSAKRFNSQDNDTTAFYPLLAIIYETADLGLYVTNIIEGFWDGSVMVEDTMTVRMRNSVSPYGIADIDKSFAGQFGALYCFHNLNSGNYYIEVRHRNSIETWSKFPITVVQGNSDFYDFSDLASKAYGDNEVLKQGVYCFYGGDVNQDGTVDLTDIVNIYNDANNFVTGYVVTDVTGDDFVDLSDVTLAFNNSNLFVSVMRP